MIVADTECQLTDGADAAQADDDAGQDGLRLRVPPLELANCLGEVSRLVAPAVAGKIVTSCVNPLSFDMRGAFGLPMPESAAEHLQRLAPAARVVGAFHHVSAKLLWDHKGPLGQDDILVAGDDNEAVGLVTELCRAVTGKVGIRAGALRVTH